MFSENQAQQQQQLRRDFEAMTDNHLCTLQTCRDRVEEFKEAVAQDVAQDIPAVVNEMHNLIQFFKRVCDVEVPFDDIGQILEEPQLALQVNVGAGGRIKEIVMKELAENFYKEAKHILILSFDEANGVFEENSNEFKTELTELHLGTVTETLRSDDQPQQLRKMEFEVEEEGGIKKTFYIFCVKKNLNIENPSAQLLFQKVQSLTKTAFVCGIDWGVCRTIFWKEHYAQNFKVYVFCHGDACSLILDIEELGVEKVTTLLNKPGPSLSHIKSQCRGFKPDASSCQDM
mmetsp:Transcript_26929/g.52813  ORF Transcript_26929/g.52813 Transcript_26929/m.52813 type:complete len:288 (+) Transcript_26929:268-1131(+)